MQLGDGPGDTAVGTSRSPHTSYHTCRTIALSDIDALSQTYFPPLSPTLDLHGLRTTLQDLRVTVPGARLAVGE